MKSGSWRSFLRGCFPGVGADLGDPTHVPSKRLPDWASLELSPSVESCGCGLGPSPVRSPVSWVPKVRPSSGETAPEKRSPGTAFHPGCEMLFTGSKASKPPTEKKRPYCPWRSRLPECVKTDWCHTGLSSAIACSSELGLRPTWRRVWVQISKYCQGL